MDVITAHQNGFNNVVASMGTSVTEKQVSTLKRLTRNMALALDADTAGEEAMLRGVGYENTLDAEVRVIILPGGKDPDDVIKEDAKIWQHLLEEALPVVDYTFNMVTSELDLTTAKDKTLTVSKLLPIIAEIKDPVRQAHYLQKLARIVKVSERSIEAALTKVKTSQGRPKAKESHPPHPLLSNRLEEYCLALLLQHPELKQSGQAPLPEYFQDTGNREIFIALQGRVKDLPSLKEKLDPAIWEHLDSLITKNLPANQIEQKYANCVLRLREKFLRDLEAKRGEILALAAETGGIDAELATLHEQGIEVSTQLGEVFAQKNQRSASKETGHGI